MAKIEIEIDDQAVTGAFNRLLALRADFSPVLEAIGRQLESNVRLGFDRSQDPYGRPWLPLKVRQGQPLVDSGHLRDSITHQVEGDSVWVGTNLDYAQIQNFGGTIKPVNAKSLRFYVNGRPVFVGGPVTIPARPFMPNAEEGLPDSWSADLVAISNQVIESAIAQNGP